VIPKGPTGSTGTAPPRRRWPSGRQSCIAGDREHPGGRSGSSRARRYRHRPCPCQPERPSLRRSPRFPWIRSGLPIPRECSERWPLGTVIADNRWDPPHVPEGWPAVGTRHARSPAIAPTADGPVVDRRRSVSPPVGERSLDGIIRSHGTRGHSGRLGRSRGRERDNRLVGSAAVPAVG